MRAAGGTAAAAQSTARPVDQLSAALLRHGRRAPRPAAVPRVALLQARQQTAGDLIVDAAAGLATIKLREPISVAPAGARPVMRPEERATARARAQLAAARNAPGGPQLPSSTEGARDDRRRRFVARLNQNQRHNPGGQPQREDRPPRPARPAAGPGRPAPPADYSVAFLDDPLVLAAGPAEAVARVNALIRRCASLPQALALVEALVSRHLPPDESTYVGLIYACRRTRQAERALVIYEAMKHAGIVPRRETFNVLIACAGQARLAEEAFKLRAEMIQAGHAPDLVTYTTLMRIAAANPAAAAAAGIALHPEVGQAVAAAVAGETVAGAEAAPAVAVAKGHANPPPRLAAALSVLETARAAGLTPDAVTYNTLILAAGEAGRPELALSMYAEMQAAGVEADRETFDLLLTAAASAGRLPQALAVYRQMRAGGHAPTRETYNRLLGCCGTAAQPQAETAFEIFHEMNTMAEAEQVRSRMAGRARVIAAAAAEAAAAEGAGVAEAAAGAGASAAAAAEPLSTGATAGAAAAAAPAAGARVARPNADTYDALITVACRANNPTYAFDAFELMRKAGCKAKRSTYNALIHVAGGLAPYSAQPAFAVYEAMKEAGVKPDALTFAALMTACARVRDADAALALGPAMAAAGVRRTTAVAHALMATLARAGRWEEVVEQFFCVLAESQWLPNPSLGAAGRRRAGMWAGRPRQGPVLTGPLGPEEGTAELTGGMEGGVDLAEGMEGAEDWEDATEAGAAEDDDNCAPSLHLIEGALAADLSRAAAAAAAGPVSAGAGAGAGAALLGGNTARLRRERLGGGRHGGPGPAQAPPAPIAPDQTTMALVFDACLGPDGIDVGLAQRSLAPPGAQSDFLRGRAARAAIGVYREALVFGLVPAVEPLAARHLKAGYRADLRGLPRAAALVAVLAVLYRIGKLDAWGEGDLVFVTANAGDAAGAGGARGRLAAAAEALLTRLGLRCAHEAATAGHCVVVASKELRAWLYDSKKSLYLSMAEAGDVIPATRGELCRGMPGYAAWSAARTRAQLGEMHAALAAAEGRPEGEPASAAAGGAQQRPQRKGPGPRGPAGLGRGLPPRPTNHLLGGAAGAAGGALAAAAIAAM